MNTLDPVDAAWYHMDSASNPAIVTMIATTAAPLAFARVRSVLERRLLLFERFRQRVVETGWPLAAPAWEDVPDFDIDRHLHRIALPAPHDEAALLALVGQLASQPLDHALPLWQAHVVDRVGRGSALVFRYHHCIGDGLAMMSVAAKVFSVPRRRVAMPAAARPRTPHATTLDTALEAASAVSSLATVLLKPADPVSPFKGRVAATQGVAWSKPVPIADARAIGATVDAKVNDVLVAATAGALRRYLLRQGVDARQATLRAMVPVNLRPAERLGLLGNAFGLVTLDLPVSAATAARRLALTKARMDALKQSPQALAMQALFDLFGRGPKVLEDVASKVFGSKASLVLTNVAGPRETVQLAGVPVERLMFCVPHPGDELGVGISLFSYRGMATLTVMADAGLVPDPQAITQGFEREFTALARRVTPRARRRVAKPRSRGARRRV